MTYFRHDAPLASGQTVELAGEEGRHLLQSRRMRPGERFALQDPQGRRFAAELLEAGRHAARVAIGDALPVPPPPPREVTLLQAAVKEKAAELLVEKCTELGVAALAFFPGTHSAVARGALDGGRTRTRWERIAWEACKQSDRQFPPRIAVWPTLADVLAAHGAGSGAQGWVLEPTAPQAAAATLTQDAPARLHVLIGPEGGLTPDEVHQATAAGYTPVHLGPTILRAETAALAACALALLGGP